MTLEQPPTGLCGQKIGGQLGCMLPAGHEGPHDIGGGLRRRVPVVKPVETPAPQPAAPPPPKKSKAGPAATEPRPGPVAAGELAWAKIKGYSWWPARVEAVGNSTVDVLFFGTQQLGRPKKTDVVPFASRDAKQLAERDPRFAKQLAGKLGLNAAISEAQASLLPKAEARCKCATVEECKCAHVHAPKAQARRPKAVTGGGGSGGDGGDGGGGGGSGSGGSLPAGNGKIPVASGGGNGALVGARRAGDGSSGRAGVISCGCARDGLPAWVHPRWSRGRGSGRRRRRRLGPTRDNRNSRRRPHRAAAIRVG